MPAVLAALFLLTLFPSWVHSAEKLMVKDAGGTAAFSVEDNGRVYTVDRYDAQSRYPGFWLDETGTGHKGAYFVLGENWMQVQRRAQNFGGYEASPVFINIGAPHAALVIDQTGYAGFGKWGPSYPLHMASGAYCTAGGVWTDASSREYKQDIKAITKEEALNALNDLAPVQFRYKAAPEEKHVGFIAEDAPDLVASKDRKGMSAMDVVAVLTRVVQDQQKTIADLSRKVADLQKANE
ncbi:MAG: tail fiber domain-containing protein [Candidatus Desulfacyla sp.]